VRRFLHLFAADVRFQFRYGFYGLYLFFTVLYVAVVRVLPGGPGGVVQNAVRDLVTLTDPAALGLFFMGAIVLFEKDERVHRSLAVSPAGAGEYAAAKACSLSLVSALAGSAIILFSGGVLNAWTVIGLLLASALFSLAGLLVGTRAPTLNGYMILSVPFELALFLPAILWYFASSGILNTQSGWASCLRFAAHPAWIAHPGAAALVLIGSGGRSAPAALEFAALASLVFWTAALAFAAVPAVDRMICGEGEK